MSDLTWYKVRLGLILIFAVGGVIVWAGLNYIESKSCQSLLQERGVFLDDSANTPSSSGCSELDYQNVVNASDRVAICKPDPDATHAVINDAERINNQSVPEGSCAVISQQYDFQNSER